MFVKTLKWKDFKVSLDKLGAFLKEKHASYKGSQAGTELTLYFSEPLSAKEEAEIDAFWKSLKADGYKTQAEILTQQVQLNKMIQTTKESMLLKSWDELSVPERKIAMGMEITLADMGLE